MIKILLITNKADVTSDFIVRQLSFHNIPFYRFNTEELSRSVEISFNIAEDKFILFDKILNISIDLLKIKSVYFRRPEIDIDTDSLTSGELNFIKSEMFFTLEGLYKVLHKSFWLNNIDSIRKAENKVYQLLVANEIGLNIPKAIITNNSVDGFNFYKLHGDNCIIKPIKSGLIEGEKEEGVVFTSKLELTKENIKRLESCPVYLQELIQKKGDIRVTVVGEKIFSAFIHSQDLIEAKVDWRKAGIPLKHSVMELPEDIADKCFQLCKKLSLNFGAIDFILDKNDKYIFLEINPNGQWAWIEKQLNYPISDHISNLLIEKSIN